MWTILKSLLNLLQYWFCLIFCFQGHMACGIFDPWFKDQTPMPSALEGEVLTTEPPGKSSKKKSLTQLLLDYFSLSISSKMVRFSLAPLFYYSYYLKIINFLASFS